MLPDEPEKFVLRMAELNRQRFRGGAVLGLARRASTEASHWHLLTCLLMPRSQSGRLLGMASPRTLWVSLWVLVFLTNCVALPRNCLAVVQSA